MRCNAMKKKALQRTARSAAAFLLAVSLLLPVRQIAFAAGDITLSAENASFATGKDFGSGYGSELVSGEAGSTSANPGLEIYFTDYATGEKAGVVNTYNAVTGGVTGGSGNFFFHAKDTDVSLNYWDALQTGETGQMVIKKTDDSAFWLKELKILFGGNVDLTITGYKGETSVGVTYKVTDVNGTAKLVTLTGAQLPSSIFQNVDKVTVTGSNYNKTTEYDGRLDTGITVMTESITVGDPPDITAPVLSAVSVSDRAESTAVLHFTSDEAGTYYYLVYAAADTAPSAANVKAQGTAVAKGSGAAVSGGNTVSLSGLTAATAYRVYVVEADPSANLSAVASASFSTSPTVGVAAQSGALTAGTPGSAAYVVTPKAFTNNASLTGDNYTIKWYTNAAGTTGETSAAPAGVTMTKTDAATLTASIDATAQAGIYYFRLTAADQTVTPAETATSNVAVLTVAKASYTPLPSSKTVLIYNDGVRTGSGSLSDLLTSVPGGAAFGTITPPASPQVLSTLAVNGTDTGKLDYTSLNNASDATASDTYTVHITSTNYQDIPVDLIFTATPKTAVTVAGLSAPANRSYTGTPVASSEFGTPAVTGHGELDSSLVYTYSGTGSTVYGPTAAAPTNAGTYQLTVSVPAANQTYTGSETVSFTISPAAVTVGAGTAHITKVYDGTVDAGAPSGALSISGILPADNGVSVQPGTVPAFTSKTVGVDTSLPLPVTITGDTVGNYQLSSATVSVPASITAKNVTVSGMTVDNKSYDGTNAATLHTDAAVFTGRIGSDQLTVSASASFENETAGTGKTVTISGLTLGGGDAINYQLASTGQQTTAAADISRAVRTMAAPSAANAGIDTIALNASVPSAGAGDGVIFYAMSSTDTLPADGWQTSPVFTGLARNTSYYFFARVTGGSNYLDAVSTGHAITTSDRTVVLLSGVTVASRIYDGTAAAAVGTPVSSVGNIAAAGYDYLYTGRNGTTYQSTDAPKNAGDYTLTVSIKDSNLLYTGHMTVDFSISKATATVTAASKTAQVDDPVPSLAPQDYTVSGLAAGDSLLTVPTLAYAAVPDMTRPGTVAIKASGAAAGDNYTLVYTDGLLTVSARPQITFQSNGGSAVAVAAAQKNGTVQQPVDPTREGHTFLGWYADAALTRGWDFASDTVTADTTLYAKWAVAATYAVSGTVSTAGTPVSGAVVRLMRGTVEYQRATTASDGSYHLTGIMPGTYNAVATSRDVTQTLLVTVANSDLTRQNIQMPSGDVNSLLELTGTATPNVVVGGLDAEASAVAAQQGGSATTVVVKMTVEQKAESALTDVPVTKAEVSAIKSSLTASPDKHLHFEFLEISVTKTVGTDAASGTTTKMGTTSHVLEIVIPYDTTGKANIRILQYHEGEGVRPFTEDIAHGGADGTFYIDMAAQQIHLFTQKFSTYAISYETALPVTPVAPAEPAAPTGTVSSPATGDSSDLFFFLTMGAGSLLAALYILSKKRRSAQ